MPKRTRTFDYVDIYQGGCLWFRKRSKDEGFERKPDDGVVQIRDPVNNGLNYQTAHLKTDSVHYLINDLLWFYRSNDNDILKVMQEMHTFKHRGPEILSHERTRQALGSYKINCLAMALVLNRKEIDVVYSMIYEADLLPASKEWFEDWIKWLKRLFGMSRAKWIISMRSFFSILERTLTAEVLFEVLSGHLEWNEFPSTMRSEKNALYFVKYSDNFSPIIEDYPDSVDLHLAMVKTCRWYYRAVSKKMRNTKCIYEAFLDSFADRAIGISFLSKNLQMKIKQ